MYWCLVMGRWPGERVEEGPATGGGDHPGTGDNNESLAEA